MLQAIQTRRLATTNTRDARMRATAWAGSVTVPYDYDLTAQENHESAARALCERLGWGGKWHPALLPSGEWCHVSLD